jgi:serine kinase of HPr protein (carbohydrate metabolism regulator)
VKESDEAGKDGDAREKAWEGSNTNFGSSNESTASVMEVRTIMASRMRSGCKIVEAA